jgi:hypothetical protein
MTRLPIPTEEQLLTRLRRGEVAMPPLRLTWAESRVTAVDGVLLVAWQKQTRRFAVECKRASNPKAVAEAAEQARGVAGKAKLEPLVVVPYLDEPALDALEATEVSGIDMCGNGVVIAPGAWFVRRDGRPNLFRAEGAIKNVYRKGSSVVARLFLARPAFDSVQDALDEITRRGGRVTLPTVSKVCKELENDLVVERKRSGVTQLRLMQPEKLLDRLAANYSPPRVTRRLTGKLRGIEAAESQALLARWAETAKERIALSGTSSVAEYAVMARDGTQEYYCTDVAAAARALGDRFQPTERFATLSLLETCEEEVYFDRREDLTASPVQTFLELAAGDKRDQETAEQVRRVVLSAVSQAVGK